LEKIADGDPEVLKHADPDDIRFLQYKLPSYTSDRRKIKKKIDDGHLFPSLINLVIRAKVLENILALDLIIPSMETFHKNMIYFSIASKILRKYIVDDDLADETLFSNLNRYWDSSQQHVLQTGENEFQNLFIGDVYLVYIMAFLIPLRLFNRLSSVRPLLDKRSEVFMNTYVYDYYKLLLYN
jgi:hypothetical protein